MKKADSNEGLDGKDFYHFQIYIFTLDSSSKTNRVLTATQNKGPVSPKPPPPLAAGLRRSLLVNTTEQESVPISPDPIYNNVIRTNKKEMHTEDEGDLIEHEILDIVEQEELKEQHRNTPPTLPEKKRTAPMVNENNIDIELDPTNKLVHPGIIEHQFRNLRNIFVEGKFRVRPAKRQPPARRGTNGGSHDSSSDGGLDNDDNSIGDAPSTSTIETSNVNPSVTSTGDPQTNELPPK